MSAVNRGWCAGGLLLLAASAGCGSDDTDDTTRQASAWEQVIRAVALDEAPRGEDEPLPVVFALQADGDDVPAEVQVEVVNALIDEADLRFADDRENVVDLEQPGEPVKDDGVLVMMAAPPEGDGNTAGDVTVEVTRYRMTDEESTFAVELTGGAPSWTVAAVDLLE